MTPPRALHTAAARTFVLPLLRGCGQMLFQPSALTGSMFLLLILGRSAEAFALCLAGVFGSTLCACAIERPHRDYFEGLGGFNGGLLGLALWVFYPFSLGLLPLALAGGAITGLVRVGLMKMLPLPPFTAPFVLAGWLAFVLGGLPDPSPMGAASMIGGREYAIVTNASQVLFLRDPWVGALVLVAVLLNSRVAAQWIGGASLVAWLTTVAFGLPAGPAAAGLLGYNALILAAALQHRGTPLPWAVAGVVASVFLSYAFIDTGFTPLSAPFVLSAWAVIAVETKFSRRG